MNARIKPLIVVVLVSVLAGGAYPVAAESVGGGSGGSVRLATATFSVGEVTIEVTASERQGFSMDVDGDGGLDRQSSSTSGVDVEYRYADGSVVRCTSDLDGDGDLFTYDDATGAASVSSEVCKTDLEWEPEGTTARYGGAGGGGRIAVHSSGGGAGGAIYLVTASRASGTAGGMEVGEDDQVSAETRMGLTHSGRLLDADDEPAPALSTGGTLDVCGGDLACVAESSEKEAVAHFTIQGGHLLEVEVSDTDVRAMSINDDGLPMDTTKKSTTLTITIDGRQVCQAELGPDAFSYDPDTGNASLRSPDPCPAEVDWDTGDDPAALSQDGTIAAWGVDDLSVASDGGSESSHSAEASGRVLDFDVEGAGQTRAKNYNSTRSNTSVSG